MSQRWRETAFRVRGRVFAFIGSAAAPSVTVKVERAARRRALARTGVRRARYIGIFGWLTVNVSDAHSLEVALELVDQSYRLAARR
jgi:predicted DNA-binding protein (MmcQ/YjbR family)